MRKIFTFLMIILVLPSIALAGLTSGVVVKYSRSLPNINSLLAYKPVETTRMYSSEGELIAELYEENRTWIPLSVMPEHLINAILAIEDDQFYKHSGVSFKGLGRALFTNLQGKEISQGGSTITMQLARNLFLSPEQSYKRKVKEMLLSLKIEKQFTKDEILELYLNQIPFGSGAFGVEAASQIYFGKSVSKINLKEAALLAGLPQAPSLYSPYVNMEAARNRRNLVLQRMKDLGFITALELKEYITEPVKVIDYKPIGFKGFKSPYFSTYCLHELVEKYGSEKIYRGGLRVYSTLDSKLQAYGEDCVKWGVDQGIYGYAYCDQGSLVCIENKTGYIKAMVGGCEYKQKDQFNRAWQARRQPGSSFKIFVYTAAVDRGFTPDTICYDNPVTYTTTSGESYSPMNSDHKFYGAIPLKDAIRWSRNVVAVKTMNEIGIDTVIQYAHAMGIKEDLPPVLSLALGCATITPLEMASAVSVIPDMGIKFEPTTIKKIIDGDGNIVEDNTNPGGKEILSVDTAYTMADMLKRAIESGTGRNARIDRPAAGKTGTTSDFKDAWFVGFTPKYTTSVWIGRDDNKPMNHVYGGDYPAMTWARFMLYAHKGLPVENFHLPEGNFIQVKVCAISGLLADKNCPSTIHMFEPGSEPLTTCSMNHRKNISNYTETTTNSSPQTKSGNDSGKIDEPLIDGIVIPPDE
ncbi:MAG TPA: penicillin-binding protein 1A [Candidatus Eremiobacteraeota bacterium]|nr:penicillin-binding protein 1A [Candidatus Eremiobacteraeota bacterium]